MASTQDNLIEAFAGESQANRKGGVIMHDRFSLSRRQFLVGSGLLAGSAVLPRQAQAAAVAGSPEAVGVARRRMGKTDLMLPVISLGTGPGQAVNVMKFAISKGVNLIHTSTEYAGGRAIRNVGEAIKGQREKVTLGVKVTWNPEDLQAFDAVLGTLGTDHVDIAFFNIHKGTTVSQGKWKRAATALKKAGKCKYIGITSHSDVQACMNAALDQGFYDVLMPAYNLGQEAAFRDVFQRAEKAGVGVMLMKSARGLKGDDYYKAIPRYLETPAITTVSKGMNAFAQITRMIEASSETLSREDQARMDEVSRTAMVGRCQMCGVCGDACTRGVAVPDVVRCSEYYLEDSDQYVTARETYASIKRPTVSVCGDCNACEQACPNGVPVLHHLRRANAVLG